MIAASINHNNGDPDLALLSLTGVLAFLVFFFLNRKIAALKTKLSPASFNNPQGGPHQHSRLAKLYFRTVGFLVANILGRFFQYDQRHRDFFSSGSVCQQCGETLLNSSWMPLARCLDSAGNPVPMMEINKRGAQCECPICQFRWPIRKKDK